ncbi:MAG: hydrogenase maturation nickel metallochaperone HypA [Chloroflexota bacterium]|nr:hydrogenase maturation nickel metallochaperone HypA [Chloroflexota bacterium]
MHELGITENILRIAVEHAERAGARRITDISIVIGDLSSVVDDSVQFYFDFLSQGTLAEEARLHFHRVAARLRCRQCEQEFTPRDMDWHCPNCEAQGGEVIAGREFYVETIEVE